MYEIKVDLLFGNMLSNSSCRLIRGGRDDASLLLLKNESWIQLKSLTANWKWGKGKEVGV